MLRSFKLKMALFSLGTSGIILLAFGALFISVIRRAGLERVDRHLQALTEGHLRHPEPTEHWPRFDDSLRSLYGENSRRRFLVCVIGSDGTPVYASPDWPKTLDRARLIPPNIGSYRDVADNPPPRPFDPSDDNAFEHRPLQPRLNRPVTRPENEPFMRLRLAPPCFLTVRADGRNWRFSTMRNANVTLLLGTDMADLQTELRRFTLAYAMAVPLGLLLLASGGWLLAKKALQPIRVLTHVAETITAKGLDQRVQADDADQEFQALINVINGMLNRLEISFRQAARFSADAAHELKTPLTILQGQLNQALHSAPSESEEQRTYASLLDEVQRLKSIVRKLLLLAQSDSGQLHLSMQTVSLNQELEALFEDLPLLAPDIALEKDLEPDVCVTADPDLLRQVLHNLVSNAVKYNLTHGQLACQLRRENGQAILSLSNTVPPDVNIDRDRLFDRFYRGDAAHNRTIDGTGLGLSLAREISRAHGGNLSAEDAREGWITFRLSLPLPQPVSPAATPPDEHAQV